MFKWVKISTALVLAAASLYLFGRAYNALTDGFSIGNITYDKPFNPAWQTPDSPSYLKKALSQPYTYLGKGHQSFVFESEDKKYVIKFLKCHLVEIKPWLAWLPLPAFLGAWRGRRVQAKCKRLDGIFTGWMIAHTALPELTGVLAVHMNVTENLYAPLKVKNKAGWSYEVDLDKTAFLLQRKVDMLLPTIDGLMAEGKQTQAQSILQALLATYRQLCAQGVSDRDPQIMRNTGVSKGAPVLIDVGRLKLDFRVQQDEACKKEILHKTRLFSKWLQDQYPSLALFFEQQLDELRSSHVAVPE